MDKDAKSYLSNPLENVLETEDKENKIKYPPCLY